MRWEDQTDRSTGTSTVAAMVDYIDNREGETFAFESNVRADIHTRHPQHGAPFVQTAADGVWTNNLLNLPRF